MKKNLRKKSLRQDEVNEDEGFIREAVIPLGISNNSKTLCHLISVFQLFPKKDFFNDDDIDDSNNSKYMEAVRYLSILNLSPELRGQYLAENFGLEER